WIQAAYNPIYDLNGKPFKVVKYAMDITKQKLEIEKSKEEMKKAISDLDLQNRIRSAVETISNSIRGEFNTSELASRLFSKFADLIKIEVGAFYLVKEDKLELISTYAYKKRKNLSNVFDMGEGLVGQCAKEKKTIVISNVPDDYIKVSSGLGEATPSIIMVMPIMFEGKLLAVLEIAKINALSDEEIKVLEDSSENIGVTFNSATARDEMKVLLEESTKQSAELQAQQEELRCTNEELEAQQDKLKESNEDLEKQAEELKRSEEDIKIKNDKLRETTLSLEGQTRELEKKTILVEEAKDDIEEKARALEISSKYKSEFLANMSHELRTPLNSLLILSKTLADNEEGNLTNEQKESAEVIHSGGTDLLTLINDILDLSKVEAGKLQIHVENVKLDSIVNNLRSQFDPVAKQKGLEFKQDITTTISSMVKTDGNRIEQILKNFLSNAFKFTTRGSVTLKVHQPSPEVHFSLSSFSKENCIGISVIDTGIGIPKDKQAIIFEAFQQGDGSTNRRFGGTGLGLSISRELAKILGCEIHVHSEKDKGSTFTLYIPVEYKSTPPDEGTPQKLMVKTERPLVNENPFNMNVEEQGSSASISMNILQDDRDNITENDKSLLIIEDDVNFSRILMNFSRKRGFKCLVAENGRNGLQLATQYKPSAITLDMNLPDIGGDRVLDQLKFNLDTRHIPIHVISVEEKTIASQQQGAIGHLIKPASSKDLDKVFSKFDFINREGVKKILVVEDDKNSQQVISQLIENKGIIVNTTDSGKKACNLIKKEEFDCVILDLKLPDMTGFEVLKKLAKEPSLNLPPIIIYTGMDLSEEEYKELSMYTSSFVIKGVKSHERLLDELFLFLHSVKSTLSGKQQKIIDKLHIPEKWLQNRKILLVDDDMRNTYALSSVLRKKGLEIVMADNGKLALEKLESEEGIELVIMDIMMPVMDGYEAMRRIRQNKRFSNLPIIALTAKVLPEDKAKALESGANDFLTKPVEVKKLLSLIQIWLFQSTEKEHQLIGS
ncbi:MAG: hypothetical protein K940chlam3_01463, partial [Chlamydiae bacterium]|nr:hypothetical protein [Chlamydiota bacterium]